MPVEKARPTEFESASPMQRVMAEAIDAVVIAFPVAAVAAFGEHLLTILLVLLLLAAGLLYRIFGDSFFGGQALGKRLLKIRVVSADRDRPFTHQQDLLRNCVLFIPMMPLIEAVLLFIDGQERWGDKLARTYVLRDQALNPPPHEPDHPLRLEGLGETLRHHQADPVK